MVVVVVVVVGNGKGGYTQEANELSIKLKFSAVGIVVVAVVVTVVVFVADRRFLLGFSVLPSTLEGTRRVPRSGKFVRWALRRCYAGDVTIMKS